MELKLSVDRCFFAELRKTLGEHDALSVVRDALTLLNWAAGERKKGRVILSADSDGQSVERLAMPSLDGVESKTRR